MTDKTSGRRNYKCPPPDFNQCETYERFKKELSVWEDITDVPSEERAGVVAWSLPAKHASRIRQKVFDNVEIKDLKKADGLKELMTYMDTVLEKDKLALQWERWREWESKSRASDQSMEEYIRQYDELCSNLDKSSLTLPKPILAFQLLWSSKISENEQKLVKTGLDYSKQTEMYSDVQTSLMKFCGQAAESGASGSSEKSDDVAIKHEPVFCSGRGGYGRRRGFGRRGFYD